MAESITALQLVNIGGDAVPVLPVTDYNALLNKPDISGLIGGSSKFKSCIRLLEGNLMTSDGDVLSLSPYDKSKAATFDPATGLNTADPTTMPSTVLVYFKSEFVDPGWEIYDKNGILLDTTVSVKVMDMDGAILKTVSNYRGLKTLNSADAVNTSKQFNTFAEGTFKLEYSATVDGSVKTAVRYVKLRYLRGDGNRDGTIRPIYSVGERDDTYLVKMANYQGTHGHDYNDSENNVVISNEVLVSIIDLNRDGYTNTVDISLTKGIIEGAFYLVQDFKPFGTFVNLDFSKSLNNHDHSTLMYTYATEIGFKAYAQGQSTALGAFASASDDGFAKGAYTSCKRYAEESRNANAVSNGNIYYSTVTWNSITTSTSLAEIFLGRTSNQRCILLENSAINFHIMVTGFDGTNAKTFEVKGTIKRTTTTALVGTVTSTVLSADSGASGWNVEFSADNANAALVMKASGGTTAKPVTWVARGELTEIRGLI